MAVEIGMEDNSEIKHEVTEMCAHSQAPYPNTILLYGGTV